MAQAAQDIAAVRAWVKASSPGRYLSLLGDWVCPPSFAALLPVDPDAPAGPQHDLSLLADGGLVFLCPQDQLAAPLCAGRLERTTDGPPSPADRVAHLFGHRLGVDLPEVLTLALDDPGLSLTDALSGEGMSDIDLAAVAVVAVPL